MTFLLVYTQVADVCIRQIKILAGTTPELVSNVPVKHYATLSDSRESI
jgi:hypothetical protein